MSIYTITGWDRQHCQRTSTSHTYHRTVGQLTASQRYCRNNAMRTGSCYWTSNSSLLILLQLNARNYGSKLPEFRQQTDIILTTNWLYSTGMLAASWRQAGGIPAAFFYKNSGGELVAFPRNSDRKLAASWRQTRSKLSVLPKTSRRKANSILQGVLASASWQLSLG